MPEPTLIEGDAGDTIAVSFETPDADGNLVAYTPTTIEYRVDCLTNAQEIKDWTAITPVASSVTVTLDADDTEILDDDHEAEQRQITVAADRGTAGQKTAYYRTWVQNLTIYS